MRGFQRRKLGPDRRDLLRQRRFGGLIGGLGCGQMRGLGGLLGAARLRRGLCPQRRGLRRAGGFMLAQIAAQLPPAFRQRQHRTKPVQIRGGLLPGGFGTVARGLQIGEPLGRRRLRRPGRARFGCGRPGLGSGGQDLRIKPRGLIPDRGEILERLFARLQRRLRPGGGLRRHPGAFGGGKACGLRCRQRLMRRLQCLFRP